MNKMAKLFGGCKWIALAAAFAACSGAGSPLTNSTAESDAGAAGEATAGTATPTAGASSSAGAGTAEAAGSPGEAGFADAASAGAAGEPDESFAGAHSVGGAIGSGGSVGAQGGAPAGGQPNAGAGQGGQAMAGGSAGGGAAPTCECVSGGCCDGCHLLPSTYSCGTHLVHKMTCAVVPSGDVSTAYSLEYGDLFCDGKEPDCTRWVITGSVVKSCPQNQICGTSSTPGSMPACS